MILSKHLISKLINTFFNKHLIFNKCLCYNCLCPLWSSAMIVKSQTHTTETFLGTPQGSKLKKTILGRWRQTALWKLMVCVIAGKISTLCPYILNYFFDTHFTYVFLPRKYIFNACFYWPQGSTFKLSMYNTGLT